MVTRQAVTLGATLNSCLVVFSSTRKEHRCARALAGSVLGSSSSSEECTKLTRLLSAQNLDTHIQQQRRKTVGELRGLVCGCLIQPTINRSKLYEHYSACS